MSIQCNPPLFHLQYSANIDLRTHSTFPFRSVSTQKVLNKATSSIFFPSVSQNCLLLRKDYFSIRADLLCFRMHHCNSSLRELRKFREKQREIYFLFFLQKSFIFIFKCAAKRWQKQLLQSTCARIINFLELFWISASRKSSNSIWVFQLRSVIRSLPLGDYRRDYMLVHICTFGSIELHRHHS